MSQWPSPTYVRMKRSMVGGGGSVGKAARRGVEAVVVPGDERDSWVGGKEGETRVGGTRRATTPPPASETHAPAAPRT